MVSEKLTKELTKILKNYVPQDITPEESNSYANQLSSFFRILLEGDKDEKREKEEENFIN